MVTVPTIDNFKDTTVMGVIRKIVDYLCNTLVPGINSDIQGKADSSDVTNLQQTVTNQNVTGATLAHGTGGNATIVLTITKPGGNVVSNELVIEAGSEITISQTTSGISINGTALQTASTTRTGLMQSSQVTTLNTASSNASTALTTANNITAYVGTDEDLIA